jgi:hypothetical protein
MTAGSSYTQIVSLVFLCTGLLCLCSTQSLDDSRSAAATEDSSLAGIIILTVGDTAFSQADFNRYVAHTAGEEAAGLSEASLSRLFDSFVEEKLLLAGAREWMANLPAESDEDLPLETENLPNQLLIEQWTKIMAADISLSPEEVQAYYDQHKREFLKPTRVRVSQILLTAEDKAVQAFDMVSGATESRFREVARQMSAGVEADKGGDMGVFELGQLPGDMEAVIFTLEEGEISPVVESSYGYHIFRLDKKFAPELVPEDEAAAEIESELLSQKFQGLLSTLITELKSRLDWTVDTGKLAFVYQRNDYE